MALFTLTIRRYLLFILIVVTQLSHVFAQEKSADDFRSVIRKNKADTAEVNALNGLFWLVRQKNPERAKKHLDKAMKLAESLNYRYGKAMAYRCYGSYYDSKGNYDKALLMMNNGNAIFKEMNNKDGQISCLNGIASIAINQGNYTDALEGYIQTAKLDEEMGNLSGVAIARQNIGNVYYYQGRYDKALKYFKLSLKFKESIADSTGMVISLNGIGAVYIAQENYEEALRTQLHTLTIANRVSGLHARAGISNNIGAEYFYLDKLDSARIYYRKALNIYYELGEKGELPEIYSNLGVLENTLENSKQAMAYFDSSLIIAQEVGDIQSMVESYDGLAESNKMLGNYKVAFNWYVKYHALNDSLMGETVRQNLDELQVKYETGIKDLQIVELEQSEAEATAVADKRRYLLVLLGVLASAAILLLIFYIGRRKIKVKLHTTELEQKALRSQMNPHFIFNSLNSIQRLYVEGKEDDANDYMADFSSLLRRILENSSMDRISLKEELHSTSLYLDLEKMRTDNVFDYQIDIDSTIDQLNTFVPPLILQPFVENSIWHGIVPKNDHGNITIQINKAGMNDLECIITDNGIGISESKNQKNSTTSESKGMSITADRLGGENNVVISELETGGTVIKLCIKKILRG